MSAQEQLELREDERAAARKLSGNLRAVEGQLARDLVELFSAMAFHNEYTFHPRLFPEFASELVSSLFAYLDGFECRLPRQEGRKSAESGLAERTVLSIAAIMQQTLLENLGHVDHPAWCAAVKAVNSYVDAYLEGYMKRRFEKLLQEQETLRRSVSRAREEGTTD